MTDRNDLSTLRDKLEATRGRESVARIVAFRGESSQIRKRAYTRAPANRIEMIAIVGRRFVIVTAGTTIAEIGELTVALPLALRAVTATRSRKPRSASRTP